MFFMAPTKPTNPIGAMQKEGVRPAARIFVFREHLCMPRSRRSGTMISARAGTVGDVTSAPPPYGESQAPIAF